MEQIVIALNLTRWGVEFTSPAIDIYAPWLSIALTLIGLGAWGIVRAIKTIRGNR